MIMTMHTHYINGLEFVYFFIVSFILNNANATSILLLEYYLSILAGNAIEGKSKV